MPLFVTFFSKVNKFTNFYVIVDMESKKPMNFSWVEEGKLAAFGRPSSPANLRYLLENNITYLVTLSPETPPPVHTFPDINWIEIKVREFYPPTNSQIEKFIITCEKAFSENKVKISLFTF